MQARLTALRRLGVSPKMIFRLEECPHCECEQHFSTERGTMTVTFVCHHPENEGVMCNYRGPEVMECYYVRQAAQEIEPEPGPEDEEDR